jgi:hypothetical protein
MYGPSPVRKVSALTAMFPVAFMYPASYWSVSLLRAMMEIRALSPHHSSGLFGHEPTAGLESAGLTGSPSGANNLRNPRTGIYPDAFQAAAR